MRKVIGIDLGGTKISGALLDENGNILSSAKVDTGAEEGREVVIGNIVKLIKKLPYEKARAIGIGTPGFIDSDKGIVTFAGNIKGWSGLNLKKEIEKYFDLPVFIENDANIALICEQWIGSGKAYDDIVMITLGTGLGGAVYSQGKLLRGSNFQGAELGHMILYPNGNQCTCGQKGCAECYCSGSAIGNEYEKLTGIKKTSENILSSIDKDKASKKVLDQFVINLSYYLTSLRNIFDPQVIIIGGGLINAKDLWWEGMLENFKKVCHNFETVDILAAKYLNDAGMIGAGKIALERVNND
ncbi:MAG: ROK family protein [Peptoniphilaceae bacterium]|nr:ROK family protein [Peptoniphilaceae bacterium]MDY6018662.1 ROK family protein [Anaerococcus sp.]